MLLDFKFLWMIVGGLTIHADPLDYLLLVALVFLLLYIFLRLVLTRNPKKHCRQIAKHLSLPPVKLHCSMLAEDAIKAAVKDYESKRSKLKEATPTVETATDWIFLLYKVMGKQRCSWLFKACFRNHSSLLYMLSAYFRHVTIYVYLVCSPSSVYYDWAKIIYYKLVYVLILSCMVIKSCLKALCNDNNNKILCIITMPIPATCTKKEDSCVLLWPPLFPRFLVFVFWFSWSIHFFHLCSNRGYTVLFRVLLLWQTIMLPAAWQGLNRKCYVIFNYINFNNVY